MSKNRVANYARQRGITISVTTPGYIALNTKDTVTKLREHAAEIGMAPLPTKMVKRDLIAAINQFKGAASTPSGIVDKLTPRQRRRIRKHAAKASAA